MVSSCLKGSKQRLEFPNEFSWSLKIPGEDGELWEGKVDDDRALRTRSDCEESQKDVVRPINSNKMAEEIQSRGK